MGVRPDSSGLTRLPRTGRGAFSPDGRRIAFARDDTDTSSLTVTDLSGSSPRVLLNTRKMVVGTVAWSPAGDALNIGGDEADPFAPLFEIPATGGSPRQIAQRGAYVDVSVTGRLAYQIDPGSNGAFCLFTSDANGGDARALGKGWSPSWSPDGTQLAFVDDGSIFIANPDRSGARVVWTARRGEGATDLAAAGRGPARPAPGAEAPHVRDARLADSASSIVPGSMLWPPRMIRSLARPTRRMNPAASIEARSPVSSRPSRSLSPVRSSRPAGPSAT